MIIAGIDAGLGMPGIAIVDDMSCDDCSTWNIVCTDTLRTERLDDRESVALDNVRRITEITAWMVEKLTSAGVDLCCVELPNSGAKSSRAAVAMAMASGQVIATLRTLNIKSIYYAPIQTKLVCTGNRYAEKDEMITAMAKIWPNIEWPLKHNRSKKMVIDTKKQEAIADSLGAIVTYAKLTRKPSQA